MIMTREDRILYYESLLDRVASVVRNPESTQDEIEAVRPLLQELERYYTGPEWKADYDADAAGDFPRDLKRGVLSEDGIDDVLSDFRDLEERLAALKEKKL